MTLFYICNLLILISVIIGIVLNKSITKDDTAYKNYQAIEFDTKLWRYIDIIIIIISLFIIIIFRKYIYIVILLASLLMIFNTSIRYDHDNHKFGDENHVENVSKGYLVDGLIVGIVLTSMFTESLK